MKVEILSGVNSKFGELWSTPPRMLAKNTVNQALLDAHLKIDDIDAIYVGNMLSSSLAGQDHLGAFFAEELGIHKPAFRVEAACATGGIALHQGVQGILSGMYDRILVLGIEKMTDYKPEEVAKALMGAGSDSEREAGATFPALYALIARLHMLRFGTTQEQMAAVAVKNHYHASLNSHAHFRGIITIEDVLKSPVIASPLKLLDCSPITDGASAVILSKSSGKAKKNSVFIKASCAASDSLGLAEREDLLSIKSAKIAAESAYKMAGVSPNDIDVAEVHDCFTIAEIIAMEDLGFFPKGEAGERIFNGETRLGSKLVVNTSGGLKAAGHPVGATGIKQAVEIFLQLKGQGGAKQVEGARIGLTHNVGGSGATAVVHIMEREL